MSASKAVLRKFFGYPDFRPRQQDIVDAIAQGKDVLALMATGFGKSICFQVPALIRPGVCVVVSPLIALMQDQVTTLRELGFKAESLNHTHSKEAARNIVTRLACGDVKYFYCSPETLGQGRIKAALARTVVGMFVIDEAHCISQWGHDFRPEYSRLRRILNVLSEEQQERPPRAAFTATATKKVKVDIVRSAGLQDHVEFNGGVARPNLIYRTSKTEKLRKSLYDILMSHKGEATIVYFLTIKGLQEAAESIGDPDILQYHGKISAGERSSVLSKFMKGEANVVFATDAFGMGVDKDNIRCVVNVGYPLSVEHYVQQSGRAGRDGLPAHCYMLVTNKHFFSQKFFVDRSSLSEKTLLDVWRVMLQKPGYKWPFNERSLSKELANTSGLTLSSFEVQPIVNFLEGEGCIEVFFEGKRQLIRVARAFAQAPVDELERRNLDISSKASVMREYVDFSGCKAGYIESYFTGEVVRGGCGVCQFCEPDPGQVYTESSWKVSRTLRLMKDRYGVKQTQMVLLGFRDTWKIQDRGHDKLDTFGSLAHLGAGGVKSLIDSMISCGILERTRTKFPSLRETKFGEALARSYIESGGEAQPVVRNKG